MSAWRTQRRTDSIEMSKSAATSAWLRSPRRATRTTSRLNSGRNFLGTATSFQRDLVPQMECQSALQQSQADAVFGITKSLRLLVVLDTVDSFEESLERP